MLKTYQDDRIPKRHCYVTRPQHVTIMVLEAYKITVMLPGLQIFTVLLPGRNSQYVNFLLLCRSTSIHCYIATIYYYLFSMLRWKYITDRYRLPIWVLKGVRRPIWFFILITISKKKCTNICTDAVQIKQYCFR